MALARAKAIEVPATTEAPVAGHPFIFEPAEISQAIRRFERALFDFPCDLGNAPVRISTRTVGFRVVVTGTVWGEEFAREELTLQRHSERAERWAHNAFNCACRAILRRH